MNLLGSIDRDALITKNLKGKSVNPLSLIFPIFSKSGEDDIKFIGTGFHISSDGLFLTAKHVITDAIDLGHELFSPYFLEDKTYVLRPVKYAQGDDVADIAIGVFSPQLYRETMKPLKNNFLFITNVHPAVGSQIFTYAYPKTRITNSKIPFNATIETDLFPGELLEYHEKGRDRTFLPGKCFRTNMYIHGGSSGGPVFDELGNVFAVNSTGFDNDDISYVTPISSAMELGIKTKFKGEERMVSIEYLHAHGMFTQII